MSVRSGGVIRPGEADAELASRAARRIRESSESWADLLRDCKRRGMRRRSSRSATAHWGSGRRCARCSRRPASSAAGSTSRPTCWPRCPSRRTPARRVTKGPGSRAAGIAMAFKLIESAQARWRAVNAPHLVTLVRAGATFEKGKLVERPDESGSRVTRRYAGLDCSS